jgi:hypothetical protein
MPNEFSEERQRRLGNVATPKIGDRKGPQAADSLHEPFGLSGRPSSLKTMATAGYTGKGATAVQRHDASD